MADLPSFVTIDPTGPVLDSLIRISKNKYENLLRNQYHYETLVKSLLDSGLGIGVIRILTKANPEEPVIHTSPDNLSVSEQVTPEFNEVLAPSLSQIHDSDSRDAQSLKAERLRGVENWRTHQRRPSMEGKRSVLLSNLPPSAVPSDVTSVTRGGLLTDVLMGTKAMAVVTFLTEESAALFLEHVENNGVSIKSEKVHATWSKRQFPLSEDVKHLVARGVTRNLVIRKCGEATNDRIRADLRHIDMLIIIKIDFVDGDCYIETNSVALANDARTYLVSLSHYHDLCIEWYADECNGPLV
ncbi:hypothetical protein F4804DRAFT_250763 [Jackrogersella minutella]|nr:hypothetical protein F4804DRAFT_250763 [Jackrogersella minutella]